MTSAMGMLPVVEEIPEGGDLEVDVEGREVQLGSRRKEKLLRLGVSTTRPGRRQVIYGYILFER